MLSPQLKKSSYVHPEVTKATSTKNLTQNSHVTYVFDDATEKLNQRTDYLLNYDNFIKLPDPVEDPFKAVIQKHESAKRQSFQQMLETKKKHTRVLEGLKSTTSLSRPGTAKHYLSPKTLNISIVIPSLSLISRAKLT
jgi:hypothetical protein